MREDDRDDELKQDRAKRSYLAEVKSVSEKVGLYEAALSALAEPNRMRIVELLRDGPLTVGEIADRIGLRQPQASKHLKVLSDKGIVDVQADANRRIYQLRPEPFRALDVWLHSFSRIMQERFDNLDDYLRELQSQDDPQNLND
jgi:DNA-binding transcriptional ArsR family regulator